MLDPPTGNDTVYITMKLKDLILCGETQPLQPCYRNSHSGTCSTCTVTHSHQSFQEFASLCHGENQSVKGQPTNFRPALLTGPSPQPSRIATHTVPTRGSQEQYVKSSRFGCNTPH